jgi:hypothetical protein
MKQILSLFLFASMTSVANAHALAADDGLAARLLHQLLGLHHFPITAMLIVGGIVVLGLRYRRNSR